MLAVENFGHEEYSTLSRNRAIIEVRNAFTYIDRT